MQAMSRQLDVHTHVDGDFDSLSELARFLPECISVDDARRWDGVSVSSSQHPSLLGGAGGKSVGAASGQ